MGDTNRDFDIKIAQISSANGLKGYVKLLIFLDKYEDILSFSHIFDQYQNTYKISPVIRKNDLWIVKISGIESREAAEALKGTNLYIKRSALPDLDDEQFYYEDLIGMNLVSETDVIIGQVKAVVNFGAGDILEVLPHGSDETFYHPFDKNFIISVDRSNRNIFVNLLV
jgi:16S rRNA processing protein RimM